MIRPLIAIALTLALFEPLGVLLRGQNPWNCFQATYDENVFIEAISNDLEGKGFRLTGDSKPFNPIVTVGPPLSLTTRMGAWISGGSTTQAARAGVYLCFLMLLTVLARSAYLRSSAWGASVVAVAIFSFWHSRTLAGPYLTYGVLGEVPGLLFALLALLALDKKRAWAVGALAALAFWSKPTFLFLLPALAMGATQWREKTKTAIAVGLGLLGVLSWHAIARGEGLLEYWQVFSGAARGITQDSSGATLWSSLSDGSSAGWITLAVAGLAALFTRLPSARAAIWFFALGCAYFAWMGKPTPKHAWVFCAPLVAIGAISLARRTGFWLSKAFGDETLKAITLTVIVAWLAWMPGQLKRSFAVAQVEGCPVKEQAKVSALITSKASVDQKTWLLVPQTGDGRWLKLKERVPHEVSQAAEIQFEKGQVSWVAAPASTDFPSTCKPEWLGKNYGAWRCEN